MLIGASPVTAREDAGDLEITGLIIDETISKGGHDFYDVFSNQWRSYGQDWPNIITIEEKAGIGRGTFVIILIDDSLVFNAMLNPLPDAVSSLARTAADRVRSIIMNKQETLRELDYY